MFDAILEDIKIGLRVLRRAPGFTFIVVLTLAVGIGANTAIFSVVDAILLRPLPYPDADQIVTIGIDRPESGRGEIGFAEVGYRHFLEKNRSFEDFGAYQSAAMPLAGEGDPLQLNVGLMTNSAYAVLGIPPLLGRLPSEPEDVSGGALVTVLSYGFWASRFGTDPDVLGTTISLDAQTREVIAVMPPEFAFPSDDIDLWVPLQLDPASQNVGMLRYRAIGRLRDNATIESASADADELVKRLSEVGYVPAWFESTFAGRAYADTLKEYIVSDSRGILLIVLGAVSFVLLIACANVANLFLVRAEGRVRPTAIRAAIGASRSRLIQYYMTESMILAIVGGLGGLNLAYVGIRAFQAIGPTSIPRLSDVGISGTAFGYTAGVTILTGLLFAILPSTQIKSSKLRAALAGGLWTTVGRGRLHARNILVVAQVALALVLLISSGLMVRTFQELRSVDPGFDPSGVVTFSIRLPQARYPDGGSEAVFFDRFLERARALPGVEAAGAITTLPMRPSPGYTVGVDGFPTGPDEPGPVFAHAWITPGYFEALRIPILTGRGPERADQRDDPRALFASVAIENEYWPNSSAVGRRIVTFGGPGEVVGVVGNVHLDGLDASRDRVIYLPLNWRRTPTWRSMSVAIRSAGNPTELIALLRQEVAAIDPGLPLSDIATMEGIVRDSMSRTTFTMLLLLVAAFVSMFLGSVGIYGVIRNYGLYANDCLHYI